MERSEIRILLVDDHGLFRKAIRRTVEDRLGMTVVEEANNGRDGVRLAGETQPTVALVDFAMPGLNGCDATRQIIKNSPSTRVIALSGRADAQALAQMFEAGASAYLTKDCDVEDLEAAILAVVRGEPYMDPKLESLMEIEEGKPRVRQEQLSDREREVLQLFAEGRTTRQIAAELFVSAKTVETHRSHIMSKLGLKTIAELTRYAIREGITSVEY